MATGGEEVCGPCKRRNIHKTASVWCSLCDEGLCVDCLDYHRVSKLLQDHSPMDMKIFRELEPILSSFSEKCVVHDKTFDMYCMKHCKPCCVKCVTEDHILCSDRLKPFEELSARAKSSTALHDIKQRITDLKASVKDLRENRLKNLTKIEKQETDIVNEIKTFRLSVEKQFDHFESRLLNNLFVAATTLKSEINTQILTLSQNEQNMLEFENSVNQMTRTCSNAQMFLVTNELDSRLFQKEQNFSKMKTEAKETDIYLNDPTVYISSLLKTFDIKIGNAKIPVITSSQTKCQTQQSLCDKGLVLKAEFELPSLQKPERSRFSANCTILPKGDILLLLDEYLKPRKRLSGDEIARALFPVIGVYKDLCDLYRTAADSKPSLLQFGSDGNIQDKKEIDSTVKVVAMDAINGDIALVHKDNSNSATGLTRTKISETLYKSTTIITNCKRPKAAAFSENELLVFGEGNEMKVLDFDGHVKKTVPFNTENIQRVAIHEKHICYTRSNPDCIVCCDFDGKELWTFVEIEYAKKPFGVSFDKSGKVYVACTESNTLIMISANGQHHKVLLSSKDGLRNPTGVYFDKKNDVLLLIRNPEKSAALYHVF